MTNRWKADFPIFAQTIHGHPLHYLDNAASVHKPEVVIEAMVHALRHDYSNIHRGVHALSQRISAQYEEVREDVASYINAPDPRSIVFTKGATEGLNLLAASLGEWWIKKGDVVLISALEHHANVVPWQRLCERYQAQLRVIPMDENGVLQTHNFDELLENVKIFSITQVSNALGVVPDIKPLIAKASAKGALTIVDGAQGIAHLPCDVADLGCDFYVFSGHKMYAPTGIGVLYGRYELLQAMPPYQTGGDMIKTVSFERSVYADAPAKFEAGTPPIVEVIGLGAALQWLKDNDLSAIATHEESLRAYCEQSLNALEGVRIYGRAPHKSAIVSFTLAGVHPHDVGSIVDRYGVAVRVGHHCAEPVMRFFGIPATVRASFAAYNDREDVDALIQAIKKTQELFL